MYIYIYLDQTPTKPFKIYPQMREYVPIFILYEAREPKISPQCPAPRPPPQRKKCLEKLGIPLSQSKLRPIGGQPGQLIVGTRLVGL